MPDIQLFSSLGLLVVPVFLDFNQCADIKNEMLRAIKSPATVGAGDEDRVDRAIRNVDYVKMQGEVRQEINQKLTDLIPRIKDHFSVSLSGFEKPQYLVYGVGSFYTPHRDVYSEDEMPSELLQRRVSVVIYLNGEPHNDKEYEGGNLTFYGLMKNPPWDRCGLPLQGESGLLVAFPSDLEHEVSPVTSGVRYTIVTWYY